MHETAGTRAQASATACDSIMPRRDPALASCGETGRAYSCERAKCRKAVSGQSRCARFARVRRSPASHQIYRVVTSDTRRLIAEACLAITFWRRLRRSHRRSRLGDLGQSHNSPPCVTHPLCCSHGSHSPSSSPTPGRAKEKNIVPMHMKTAPDYRASIPGTSRARIGLSHVYPGYEARIGLSRT